MKAGTTYWITGLSGAGKTTIGKKLYQYILEYKSNILFLDGDILRQVFQVDDYTHEGRKKLSYQYCRLCKMLNDQGLDVVICVISMFDECREWNRKELENYREIYLRVPIEELIRRDQKQLYSRALRHEIDDVMGINLEFEEPKKPDLVIENCGENDPDTVLDIIIKKFEI